MNQQGCTPPSSPSESSMSAESESANSIAVERAVRVGGGLAGRIKAVIL